MIKRGSVECKSCFGKSWREVRIPRKVDKRRKGKELETFITVGSILSTIAGAVFTGLDFFLLNHDDIDTKIAKAVAAAMEEAKK